MSKQYEEWTGVDLDCTLAVHTDWSTLNIGEPIQPMVNRVKQWLLEGRKVKIFTARVAVTNIYSPKVKHISSSMFAMQQEMLIRKWCLQHIGQELEVTCTKDFGMTELWDDRTVKVEKNTGNII
jgi:hypothetical protein